MSVIAESPTTHLTIKTHEVERKYADGHFHFIQLDIFTGAVR